MPRVCGSTVRVIILEWLLSGRFHGPAAHLGLYHSPSPHVLPGAQPFCVILGGGSGSTPPCCGHCHASPCPHWGSRSLWVSWEPNATLGVHKASLPFFQHTHYPQFASQEYAGRSQRGPFGDALSEFDGSVGQLLQALQENGLENTTFVFFTSDNG